MSTLAARKKSILPGTRSVANTPDCQLNWSLASKPIRIIRMSARHTHRYRGDWRYGTSEMRAKLPAGQGGCITENDGPRTSTPGFSTNCRKATSLRISIPSPLNGSVQRQLEFLAANLKRGDSSLMSAWVICCFWPLRLGSRGRSTSAFT